jgi:hypothetical protein
VTPSLLQVTPAPRDDFVVLLNIIVTFLRYQVWYIYNKLVENGIIDI